MAGNKSNNFNIDLLNGNYTMRILSFYDENNVDEACVKADLEVFLKDFDDLIRQLKPK